MKKHIPNLFTLGNLFCGLLAILAIINIDFMNAALFVVLGIVLDFFDGFLARILKVQGELGKQLDSLADVVTSGVVPGILMFFLIFEISDGNSEPDTWLAYLGFLLTLSAAYRLAKFNIDTRQSDSFIGLPTPAMSLFIISLPIIQEYTDIEFIKDLVTNNYFLIGVTLFLSWLMNANIPLLALKFKTFGWKGNEFRFSLIIISIALLVVIKALAIPLIILVYVLLSVLENVLVKKG